MNKVALPRGLRTVNRVVKALLGTGIRIGDIHVLTVVGRKSGQPRSTPVTPYEVDGERYLLGGYPGADWVHNARVAGEGTLAHGRRKKRVRLVEVPVADRGEMLRAFPEKVPNGVGMMVKAGAVTEGSPEEFAANADRFTVFRVVGA
ncbi:nitroreductase family deazaflavin-dependent oxidoreductase [Amycolatopsis magusensis]|uniref:nitroreductase family deazaflavin-dependent oxidoreductase n=1 Tax=Amycolatopsis magusensis TaxID=882444 RepID=UPI0024A8A541|nr:nitroreductase family deazaflavin-dependent oxidoreductase [Amycolatopsis magusensis]MDI5982072.1 nitroreductase family deazaflavin-dependent oxidoreductase [Amycolatopsis magusensis]